MLITTQLLKFKEILPEVLLKFREIVMPHRFHEIFLEHPVVVVVATIRYKLPFPPMALLSHFR